jgi:hypothetical protein
MRKRGKRIEISTSIERKVLEETSLSFRLFLRGKGSTSQTCLFPKVV